MDMLLMNVSFGNYEIKYINKKREGITNDFMISSTESLEKHSSIVDCLKGI